MTSTAATRGLAVPSGLLREARSDMPRSCSCAVLIAGLLAAGPSPADDDPDGDGDPRWTVALIETGIAIAIPAAWYYRTWSAASFELRWDLPSWRAKLSLDAVRFDTDTWAYNAFKHPAASIVHYQIGRTNRFGLLGSAALAAAAAVFWEYVIEYREYPSINDLIINTTTGVEIGEPLWQIGQLWRGGVVTAGDRLKTALFSPLDMIHDSVRGHGPRWRPRAWRSIALEAGGLHRRLEHDRSRTEAVLVGDIDLVADRRHVSPGARAGAIAAGSWSRIRGRLRFGDAGAGHELVGTQLASRTVIAGNYAQDDRGTGRLLALATAFTYHRDRLADSWDHVAIAHVVGPQVQISHRAPDRAVRWDLAAYGDFALIDAHVFGGSPPFPPPPPYLSALQAQGYYYGYGASATTRLRLEIGAWSLDAELDGHRIWQINGGDRVEVDTSGPAPLTAHGVSDWRLYWRAELGGRVGRWGLAAAAEGAGRGGRWRRSTRDTSELALGGVARLDL